MWIASWRCVRRWACHRAGSVSERCVPRAVAREARGASSPSVGDALRMHTKSGAMHHRATFSKNFLHIFRRVKCHKTETLGHLGNRIQHHFGPRHLAPVLEHFRQVGVTRGRRNVLHVHAVRIDLTAQTCWGEAEIRWCVDGRRPRRCWVCGRGDRVGIAGWTPGRGVLASAVVVVDDNPASAQIVCTRHALASSFSVCESDEPKPFRLPCCPVPNDGQADDFPDFIE